MEFELIDEDEGKILRDIDFPWLTSSSLILTTRSRDALGKILESQSELLPVTCRIPLWVYNSACVVGARDENHSANLRFSNGRIMDIRRYAFRKERNGSPIAFKIPQLAVSPTFLSQEIVSLYSSHNLTGLEFRQIWEAP